MFKLDNINSKGHYPLLVNLKPPPWEVKYLPISRDKARELDKAKKEGKMPNHFFVFEFGKCDEFCLDGRQMLDDFNQMQKDTKAFFHDIHDYITIATNELVKNHTLTITKE